jgi:hypothetical protein
MAKMDSVCGVHLCGKCSPLMLLFGILFLIHGLGLFTALWFNVTTIFGAFFALWGLFSLTKM